MRSVIEKAFERKKILESEITRLDNFIRDYKYYSSLKIQQDSDSLNSNKDIQKINIPFHKTESSEKERMFRRKIIKKFKTSNYTH